jgi:hypothetical protein
VSAPARAYTTQARFEFDQGRSIACMRRLRRCRATERRTVFFETMTAIPARVGVFLYVRERCAADTRVFRIVGEKPARGRRRLRGSIDLLSFLGRRDRKIGASFATTKKNGSATTRAFHTRQKAVFLGSFALFWFVRK